MLLRRLTALSAATLVLMSSVNVLAAPARSWDLSRDVMSIPGYPNVTSYSGNTVGTWSFHYGAVSAPLSLGTFTSVPNTFYWGSGGGSNTPGVFVPGQSSTYFTASFTKGLVSLHPGPTQPVIVKWAGSTTSAVRVLARFSDIDPTVSVNCADGVKWVVYKNTTVLGNGVIANGNHGAVFDTAVSVVPADNLYFVVEPNVNYSCDSTALDVLITATP
ncbi:hypothetical protein [Aestuariivirga sp.]|uniref:hypothetical protein n=1 Tax=Aestuariivirga sp. TaxID=2650926 RepID=UPI0025BF56FB|nr:hypothetical protein [Aestuariivirga sp.]MCA3555528.1 hypothetical protein [Aestuariivirga sp.]